MLNYQRVVDVVAVLMVKQKQKGLRIMDGTEALLGTPLGGIPLYIYI